MDCLNCQKCDKFEMRSWRYKCLYCHCPNYFHWSYIETCSKDTCGSINSIGCILSKTVTKLNDYKEAIEIAESRRLLWLPIGLGENNIAEFLSSYETQLGLTMNHCNRLKREMCLASQIPVGDCGVHAATSSTDKLEVDFISEADYNFKNMRDSNNFGLGEVEDVDIGEACYHCQRKYACSDKFCIRISHISTASWHILCFKCAQCQEGLVDFHYNWSDENDKIYCMRHFDELSCSRCAGCDQLIFDKEYTKAMSDDFHVEHLVCSECDVSLTGSKYIPKDEKHYCLNCFEKSFANSCDRCSLKISIDSKDLSFNTRHWHDHCFHCDNCKQSLVDQNFTTKDNGLFCSNCYDEKFATRCHGCNEPFKPGVKKFEYSGNQWHEECFRCAECNQSIGSTSFVPKNDRTICIKCYENKYAQKCSKCTQVIRKGGVTYKGGPWHRECFLCTNCNKELANTKFTSKDEKPFCGECFSNLFSRRCKKCAKPISGIGGCKFISLEDDHWHTECFTCAKCDVNLVGKEFLTHNLAIVCSVCGLA